MSEKRLVVALRWTVPLVALAAGFALAVWAQTPGGGGKGAQPSTADMELVERLIVARKDYQRTLELLRAHYVKVNDLERGKWAEDELRGFHRIPQHAYVLQLDVPNPQLKGDTNVLEANKLYTEALKYKDKGYSTDYIDNQRRAELLFQKILS